MGQGVTPLVEGLWAEVGKDEQRMADKRGINSEKQTKG